VRVANLPMSGIDIDGKTEEELKVLAEQIIVKYSKLSPEQLNYTCKTIYKTYSSKGIETTTVTGFHIPGENEEIYSYIFYYQEVIGDFTTITHALVEFMYNEKVFLDVYDIDFNEDEEFIKDISSSKVEIKNSLINYIGKHTRKGYNVKAIEFDDMIIYKENGNLYILTYADISYKNPKGNVDTCEGFIVQLSKKAE